jgi:hypothetical protein
MRPVPAAVAVELEARIAELVVASRRIEKRGGDYLRPHPFDGRPGVGGPSVGTHRPPQWRKRRLMAVPTVAEVSVSSPDPFVSSRARRCRVLWASGPLSPLCHRCRGRRPLERRALTSASDVDGAPDRRCEGANRAENRARDAIRAHGSAQDVLRDGGGWF